MREAPQSMTWPLLAPGAFEPIAERLAHKTIWYATGIGNAGDTLIHAGARCLFRRIGTRLADRGERPDFMVWCGGGNLGTVWPGSYERRRQEFALAQTMGLPIVILPQSATNLEETLPPGAVVFARETYTQALLPGSLLAPDTSLAYDEDLAEFRDHPPQFPCGIFLRHDLESAGGVDRALSLGDPPRLVPDFHGYFRLIRWFERIATDRLHFAIAALMLGRKTVLLPNSYYKNLGMYEAWLRPLGCRWGSEEMNRLLQGESYDPAAIRHQCEALRHPTQL